MRTWVINYQTDFDTVLAATVKASDIHTALGVFLATVATSSGISIESITGIGLATS